MGTDVDIVQAEQPGTSNKLIVGLGSGTAGAAVAQIVAWIIKTAWNIDMPVEIQMAMASLLTLIPGLLAAHYTPTDKPTYTDKAIVVQVPANRQTGLPP